MPAVTDRRSILNSSCVACPFFERIRDIMRKVLIAIVAVIAIVGVGVAVGLLAGRHAGVVPPVVTQAPTDGGTQPHPVVDSHADPIIIDTPHPVVDPVIVARSAPDSQTSNLAVAPTNTTLVDTNWEDKIDAIIGSDDPDTNKVKQLYALFPTLPPDGQEEVAQHLSNLVEDDNYGPLGDMLKNDKLPEGVLDELLADVLNRPNSIKLPELLSVASDANNAKSSEAKDLLELYLGEDYGSDWNNWSQHMTNWLQQNPD